MLRYEELLNQTVEFLDEYAELINCHLVDFFTEDLWTRCVPLKLREELEQRPEISLVTDEGPELSKFLDLPKSLSARFLTLDQFREISPDSSKTGLENGRRRNRPGAEFMSPKKVHEVEVLGNLIGGLAKSKDCLVVDAGAGKAYLSTYLAENYQLPVLAIDSSKRCHNGAVNRQRKLERRKNQPGSLVRYVVEEINEGTDYPGMVRDNFGSCRGEDDLLITGLHTCGQLADSVIRSFLSTERIRSLFIVPCCYHLTEETFGRYEFTRNARMLAQQSVERRRPEEISPLLFYRAVFQVFLRSIGAEEATVGRGGPKEDFVAYARWALARIGADPEKAPSTDDLEKLYRSYLVMRQRFEQFQTLRIYAGPVVEAAITLDRIVHLETSGQCSRIAALRIFDPVLSPRSYAIFATKRDK